MRCEIPPEIAEPCPKSWAEMVGTEKRRFCEHCQLHVHNLSAMTEQERQHILTNSKGRVCVAYEKDSSGYLISRTESLWLTDLFRRLGWAVFGLFAAVIPLSLSSCVKRTLTLGGYMAPPNEPLKNSIQKKETSSHSTYLGRLPMRSPTPVPTPTPSNKPHFIGKIVPPTPSPTPTSSLKKEENPMILGEFMSSSPQSVKPEN